ncbi:hypothetical protein CPC08DRAFT_644577 [Agrocybe pediades]|nr:hypothetical protein CPC08DRAFT_644577 [Agrocybe pediades]
MPKCPNVSYSRPIDPYTTTEADQQSAEEELVRALQVHTCSLSTCLKSIKGKYACKRRAPFPVSDKDWVNSEGEWGIRRLFGYLNNWNSTIMRCIRSNHDVKPLVNGVVTIKLVYYIASYATKQQKTSSNISALLATGLANHVKFDRKLKTSAKVHKRLVQRCANSLARSREFSAPEIISYLMGWGDTYESHVYVTIFWDPIVIALKLQFPELMNEWYVMYRAYNTA